MNDDFTRAVIAESKNEQLQQELRAALFQIAEKEADTMANELKVRILKEGAVVPKYARKGDAGFDLVSVEGQLIEPGDYALIKTGLAFGIPKGYEVQVRSRSGLAVKYGIQAHFGTIDEGYTGEIGVILFNFGHLPFIVEPGMKIAQGVLAQVERTDFVIVEELEETERGSNGYGSSGLMQNG